LLVSERNVPFVLGLLAPSIQPTRLLRLVLISVAVAAMTWVAWRGLNEHWIENNWITGAACTCILIAAIGWQGGQQSRLIRAVANLGDWSYALYLCHVPIILLLYQTAPRWIPSLLRWVGALVLPLMAACGLGRLDVRLYRHLRLVVDRSPPLILWLLSLVFALLFIVFGMNWAFLVKSS
jgi:peptidoglycan/LPS O-acetylase OafA/YrhL